MRNWHALEKTGMSMLVDAYGCGPMLDSYQNLYDSKGHEGVK